VIKVKTILLVEDDPTLRIGLDDALRREGFSVLPAENIAAARRLIIQPLNLALLDLNLPDGDGFTLCGEIKSRQDIPIIFLTVRDDERDITKGLDMGGDDYIVKPFRLPVLLSRIRAVLRRYEGTENDVLTCGDISLTQSQTKAAVNGHEVSLSAGEYRLLLTLLQNKSRTLTRSKLLELLWDDSGNFVNDNTLTVTMKRLRERLGDSANVIKTVRGIGYKAVEPDDE
jgi:DNA-binding response OmpR family regulator